MKRRTWLACALLVTTSLAVFSEQQFGTEITISIKPSFDIPLLDDNLFYTYGGGVAVSGSYTLPFLPFLSVGLELGYHLAPLHIGDIGNPTSLSLLYGSAPVEFRFVFLQRFELNAIATGGYYYAFINNDPAFTGHNFYVGGGLGIAYRISRLLSLGIQTQYNSFLGLYHYQAVILTMDLRLGR
jgi:hypothetical protein